MAGMGLRYEGGKWTWDDDCKILAYEKIDKEDKSMLAKTAQNIKKIPIGTSITFQDNVDNLEMIKFRRMYQRLCKPGEPEVITVQDIKDVAIFTADPTRLTPEILEFLHIPTMDTFIRAAFVYFDYYIKTYELMMHRRSQMKIKLRDYVSQIIERSIRDQLNDLRAMLSREYCNMILGAEDCYPFHHLSNQTRTSLTEKDSRLTEMLLCMLARIVWLAMHRKNFNLIEMEINRMFRTHNYNVIAHRNDASQYTEFSDIELDVLQGAPSRLRTLLQRSPTCEEILKLHDFRLIGCGIVDTGELTPKLQRLQNHYLLPEHQLLQENIEIGILGRPRGHFDAMLVELSMDEKEVSVTKFADKTGSSATQDISTQMEAEEEEVTLKSSESSISYLRGYGRSIVVELIPVEEEVVEEEELASISIESIDSSLEIPERRIEDYVCFIDPPSQKFDFPEVDTTDEQNIPAEFPKSAAKADLNPSRNRQLNKWLKRYKLFSRSSREFIS